jgi:hypothetical protein
METDGFVADNNFSLPNELFALGQSDETKKSDECLNYAISNRAEWERKGEELVNAYVEKLKRRLRK